jgi:polysaccharide export outer membrane protein
LFISLLFNIPHKDPVDRFLLSFYFGSQRQEPFDFGNEILNMSFFGRGISIALLFLSSFLFMPSCINTKKAIYFNNIQDTVLKNSNFNTEPVIQKSDLLNITVSSLNPEASLIFNTPNVVAATSASTSGAVGAMGGAAGMSGASGGGATQLIGYLVSQEGSINFPVLGALPVEGLTKKQLERKIAQTLIDKRLLVDPIVNVRFLNFRVTVLGEVARPTTINVTNERISILEALGLAGDLTIFAKRDNVLLIREVDSSKIIKRLDLNSDKILSSPYYYLKTNDVVYVEPNNAKIASTSRTQQLLPIILSGLSLIAVIISYWVKP